MVVDHNTWFVCINDIFVASDVKTCVDGSVEIIVKVVLELLGKECGDTVSVSIDNLSGDADVDDRSVDDFGEADFDATNSVDTVSGGSDIGEWSLADSAEAVDVLCISDVFVGSSFKNWVVEDLLEVYSNALMGFVDFSGDSFVGLSMDDSREVGAKELC